MAHLEDVIENPHMLLSFDKHMEEAERRRRAGMATVMAHNGDPRPDDRERISKAIMNCPTCGKKYTAKDMARDEASEDMGMSITTQHAQSLTALVQYFQNMMQLGHSEEELLGRIERPKGEHELTSTYCDELLEDLVQ